MNKSSFAFAFIIAGSVLSVSVHADDVTRGREVYQGTCIACHGANGTGAFPGVLDLTAKNGPLRNSDEVLIERITDGYRRPGSAMSMPAKGGNPRLTADDIRAVVRYMRAEFGS